MPTVNYPSWLPQCEPTSRNEVTRVLSEVSENGVVRARVMHRRPTYDLSLSHLALTAAQFTQWEAWWESHYSDEILVRWVPDGVTYQGVFQAPPEVTYAPYQRFDLSTSLLVKKRATAPVVAMTGMPGLFAPIAPADLATLQALGALGNSAAWATGEYVVLEDNSQAHWTGSVWAAGKAP